MHALSRAAAAATLLALTAPLARAQTYGVTRLPTIAGGTIRMGGGSGNAINASGQLGGVVFDGSVRTAALSGPAGSGPATPLPTLPGLNDAAIHAVSNDGRAVGEATLSRSGSRAVYWQNGQVREVGSFSSNPLYYASVANDVNSSGRVVGYSYNPANPAFQAFVTGPDGGTLSGLFGLRPDNDGTAIAIDDAGRIAGSARDAANVSHAVIWNPFSASPGAAYGPAIQIAGLAGLASSADAMADDGAVAGTATVAGQVQGWYWAGGAGSTVNFIPPMAAYQTPDYTFTGSQVRGVNSSGLVIGSQYATIVGSTNVMQRGFVYDASTNSSLLLDDLVPGWHFLTALGVNDAGLITAYGYSEETGFALEAVLLTPGAAVPAPPVVTPEPATLALLGAGLLGVAATARRRRSSHRAGAARA